MFGHQPRALSWALHDRPRLLLRKINNPEQKSKWKRKLYFAQPQLVPRGSSWFHIVWNTFCAVRTKDVGYGSVVPCKNNIHYKSSVGGRWSTSYTTASEIGGTVEPVASTQPGSPLLDRVWSGSNWWLHMGTHPCNRWNILKVGACARLHSHSLVMIVGRQGMIVVQRGFEGGVPLVGWIKGAKRAWVVKKKIGTPEGAPHG